MIAPHIFVSHSSIDEPFVIRLVDDLKELFGEEAVWFDHAQDSTGLRGGDQWWRTIVAELTAREYFVVVISPDAIKSKWVTDELTIAWSQKNSIGKRIIPIVYRKSDIPADLATLQAVSFVDADTSDGAYQRAFEQLCRALSVPPGVSVDPAVSAPIANPIIQQRLQLEVEVHEAFGSAEWRDVIRRTTTLITLASNELEMDRLATSLLWRERGFALLLVEDPDGSTALSAFESAEQKAAASKDPPNPSTYRGKAQALMLLKRYQDAVSALRFAQGLVMRDDVDERLQLSWTLCEAFQELRQADSALQEAGESLALIRKNSDKVFLQTEWLPKWLRLSAELLAAKNDYHGSLDCMEQLLSLPSPRIQDWQKALEYASLLDDSTLRDWLRKGGNLFPHDDRVLEARRKYEGIYGLHATLRMLGFGRRLCDVEEEGQKREVAVITPPLCDVPDHPNDPQFLLGDGRTGSPEPHHVRVAGFQIAKYPVTVAEYECAVRERAVPPPAWDPRITWTDQLEHPDHPVQNVRWVEAMKYAEWLADVTHEPWRLPTEAEWEKAARGRERRIYPWGNAPYIPGGKPGAPPYVPANVWESGNGHTIPIGSYPEGASPYGVQDLIGNVWEWCSSRFLPTYDDYEAHEREREDTSPKDQRTGRDVERVMRGGSWREHIEQFARAAYRMRSAGAYNFGMGGFRLALGRSAAQTADSRALGASS